MNERLTQKRKRQSLIVTVVIAIVALAYVFVVFLPKQKTIAEMRRELDRKQQFVLEVDRLRYTIQTADEELTLARNYSQQWETRSPSSSTLADLYEQLSAAANESQVAITKFDPLPVQNMNRICQLPIELAAEGSFNQMVQLLQKIESFETTIWFESLAIERLAARPPRHGTRQEEVPTGTQSDETWVQCQISLKVFADKSKFSD
jgi:Tfp pilus assembly protein PilO